MPAGPGLAAAAGKANPYVALGQSIIGTIQLLFSGGLSAREKAELWRLTNYVPGINCPEGSFKSYTSAGNFNCVCDFSKGPDFAVRTGCQLNPVRRWIPIALIGVGILVVLKK